MNHQEKLVQLRVGIDEWDKQIKNLLLRGQKMCESPVMTELLVQRMRLIQGVALLKKESGVAIFDPQREEMILSKLTEGVDAQAAERIVEFYTEYIFPVSRDLQQFIIKSC